MLEALHVDSPVPIGTEIKSTSLRTIRIVLYIAAIAMLHPKYSSGQECEGEIVVHRLIY